MRSEQEMFELILDTARNDERIRAVVMNGSRANPGAPHDRFQDFDIVYFVTDVAPYQNNLRWIERFGELMILQMPEHMGDPPPSGEEGEVYLMQFRDGNRIDLSVAPLARLSELGADSQTVVLLDKDRVIPDLRPPGDRDYLPQPPTAQAFGDCCNEFWWVLPYVAKGLWRGQIVYAKHHQDHYVRDQLDIMLTWYVGVRSGFKAGPGKFGKYLERALEPELWELLLRTYSDASDEHTWEALFAMGDLFRRTATLVAEHFGFEYPAGDDERVSAHLRHVRALPKDAREIY